MVNDISLKHDVHFVDFGCDVLRDCTGNTVLLVDGREDQSPMEKFIRALSVIRYQTVYTPLTNMTIIAASYREIMHYHSLNADSSSYL